MPTYTDEPEGEEVLKLEGNGQTPNIVLSAEYLQRLRDLQYQIEQEMMVDESAERTLDQDSPD